MAGAVSVNATGDTEIADVTESTVFSATIVNSPVEVTTGRFSLYVLVNTLIPPDNHDFVSSRRCSFTLNQAK